MIVKLFQQRFKPMVRDGSKANTIRPTPKRMPRVGDKISLRCWTGKPYRSKQEIIGESVITQVTEIIIQSEGLKMHGKYLAASTLEEFAKADGFKSFWEMQTWVKYQHGPLPFRGIFVAW